MAKREEFPKTGLVPGLKYLVDDDVNGCTFGGGTCVSINHATILNRVPQIRGQSDTQAEAVLFHALCIGIAYLGAHADQLLAVHTFPSRVFNGALLAVVPYGTYYFSIRRDLESRNTVSLHAIRMMFVQLVKLGLDPLVARSGPLRQVWWVRFLPPAMLEALVAVTRKIGLDKSHHTELPKAMVLAD